MLRAASGAALYGLLGFGLAYAFIYLALVGLAAGTTPVSLAPVPLLTLALAVLHGRARHRGRAAGDRGVFALPCVGEGRGSARAVGPVAGRERNADGGGGAGTAPWYAARAVAHARAVAALEARHECVVPFRVGAALASATLFLLTDPLAGAAVWAAAAGGFACAAAFAALVAMQRRIRRAALREGTLAALAREGQARVAREWNALARAPETTEEPESPAGHHYARDLALFGRASLFRLCGPITTPMGRERLAG